MDAERIKREWENHPDRLVKAFGDSLREFGYNIDDSLVKSKVESIYAGTPGSDIISKFLSGWIENGTDD